MGRILTGLLSLAAVLLSVNGAQAQKADWYARAVKKVEAKFEPAEAKPGQTVVFKLTIELAEGYHTYPLVQPEKSAASMVNKLATPTAGDLVFVGKPFDPKNPKSKSEPILGIDELLYYTGTLTYEQMVVVSPQAKAGPLTMALPGFFLNVCDKDNCFPAKKLTPEVTLKVLEGPAVAVEKAYQVEVEQFLRKQ
jgi:hypothetical protein